MADDASTLSVHVRLKPSHEFLYVESSLTSKAVKLKYYKYTPNYASHLGYTHRKDEMYVKVKRYYCTSFG
jgi:hypothetical protein